MYFVKKAEQTGSRSVLLPGSIVAVGEGTFRIATVSDDIVLKGLTKIASDGAATHPEGIAAPRGGGYTIPKDKSARDTT